MGTPKENWIDFYTSEKFIKGGVDSVVINFIADILYHQQYTNNCDAGEVIHTLFHSGYCYYFAVILRDAFQRGEICLAYPLGHIVWKDTNDIAYDIEGVCTSYEKLIPVSELGAAIQDFKHVRNSDATLSHLSKHLWLKHFEEKTDKLKSYESLVRRVLSDLEFDMPLNKVMSLLPTVELDEETLREVILDIKCNK